MYRGLKNTLIFAAGVAIGSVVTWKLLESKYEQILKEEEDAIREFYRSKAEKEEEEANKIEDAVEEVDDRIEEAKQLLKELKYTTQSNIEKEDKLMEPYVISPDELGELDGYDVETLTYYEDEVLTDDADNPIEDVENTVGLEFASHYGEYEEDSVCVRNDRLRCDFEILRDFRNYSDIHQGAE